MKKKILMLILLFVPFIVNASKIDDLKLKWSDSLDYDGYMYNPYLEADEEYFNYVLSQDNYLNQSKVLEVENGYIIFGNYSISKYDKHAGLQKDYQYYNMSYLIDGDLIYVVSYDYDTTTSTLDIFNTDLEIVKTFSAANYKYLSCFIEGDNLVCTARNNSSNNYHLLTVTLDKKTFEIKKESQIYTRDTPRVKSNRVFYAGYTTFYIDENYELKPEPQLENNKYTLLYNNKLHLYNLDSELEKSVDLSPSNYNPWSIRQIVQDNQIYIGVQEYLYDSTTKKYNQRVTYYLYDENLNLVDSYVIDATATSSMGSYTMYMYKNSNGIFTSFASKYYKIDQELNFTESTSNYMYNDPGFTYGESIEPNINIQASYYSAYLVDEQRELLYEELAEEYDDFYIYPTYDTYYDEEEETFTIVVNWNYIIYGSSNRTYKTKTELLVFAGSDPKLKNRITILDEEKVKDLYEPNAVMNVNDEYITIGVTSGGVTKVLFYDHDYNLVKEFKTKKTEDYAIQKAAYENGSLLIIYTEPQPEETSLSKGATTDNVFITSSSIKEFPDAKLLAGPDYHDGLYEAGDAMIVEYYEAPFNIETKTDGHGTVTATQKQADSGEEVEFEVKPNEGYVLGQVKVIDKDGNVVIFTDYKFTMPSSDVIIEATFNKIEENPETADLALLTCIITIAVGGIIVYTNTNKIKWINK